MTRIFKNIRQKLAGQNKVMAYMRYAVGEIILVVIGILIALQVNNWNEQRKAKIHEKELYGRILMDLKIDEDRINQHIDYYNNDLEVLNSIYQETQGFSKKDSLIDFSSIRSFRIFNLVITSNYSKSTKEISNPKIEKNLNEYFTREQLIKDALENIRNFKEEHVKPYLAKYGINDTGVLFKNRQLDYYKLREKNILSLPKFKAQYSTVQLDQLLFDIGVRTSWARTELEHILSMNKNLQLDLKNELGDKNSFNKEYKLTN
jgi:Family of unknown function (DUF6090)